MLQLKSLVRKMSDKQQWDNFAKESIPQLKKLGYIKNNTVIYVITAFLIGIMVSSVLFYGIYYDKFKSVQTVNLNPNIEFNSTTTNEYDIPINVENDYEHKIYINTTNYINNFISCP